MFGNGEHKSLFYFLIVMEKQMSKVSNLLNQIKNDFNEEVVDALSAAELAEAKKHAAEAEYRTTARRNLGRR